MDPHPPPSRDHAPQGVDPESLDLWNQLLPSTTAICRLFTSKLTAAESRFQLDQLRARLMVDFAAELEVLRIRLVRIGWALQMASRSLGKVTKEISRDFGTAGEPLRKNYEQKQTTLLASIAEAGGRVTSGIKEFGEASTEQMQHYEVSIRMMDAKDPHWRYRDSTSHKLLVETAITEYTRSDQINAAIGGCLNETDLTMLNADDDYRRAWEVVFGMIMLEMRFTATSILEQGKAGLERLASEITDMML